MPELERLLTRHFDKGSRPVLVVFFIAAILTGRHLLHLFSGDYGVGPDAALFLYSGERLAAGEVTYRYLWDLKPPAIHELAAFTHFVTDSRVGAYIIMFGLTGLAVILTSVFIAATLDEIGAGPVPIVAGGLAPFTYPEYAGLLESIFTVKHFAAVCAVAGLYFYVREEEIGAGVMTALAAAFWQFAAIVPLAVLLFSIHDRGRDETQHIAGGMAIAVILVVTPILALGAAPAMVGQTIIAPLVATQETSFWVAVPTAVGFLGPGVGVAGLMLYAPLSASRDQLAWSPSLSDASLLLAVVAALYIILPVVLTQFGPPDLVFPMALGGLSVGIVIESLSREAQLALAGVLGVGLVVSITTTPLTYDYGTKMEQLYWSGEVLGQCHVRMSGPEQTWISWIGGDADATACSNSWGRLWRRLL